MERRRMRLWMTGAAAVVMVAAVAAARSEDVADDDRPVVRRASPHGIDETVRRIEQAAHARGLSVFARVDADAFAPAGARDVLATRVIVLATGDDGTPVLLSEEREGDAAQPPEVPLSVTVRALPGGVAEVSFRRGDALLQDDADTTVSQEVTRALSRLPDVVAVALRD